MNSIHANRRKFVLGAGALALTTAARPAHALVQDRFQTLMRHVMGLMWVGQSRTENDQFEGGDLVTALGMKFSLMSDWSYEGVMLEVLNYNDTKYKGVFKITGECWTIGDDAGVSIYRSELMERDQLPKNLEWNTYRGDFKFYNDSNRKGHFTLQGIMTSTGGGPVSRVNLIDAED